MSEPLRISLDFDETYTAAPPFWDDFLRMAADVGIEVWCVSFRNADEMDEVKASVGRLITPARCIATGGKGKRDFMSEKHGVDIDIWIDDLPELIGDGLPLLYR